MNTTLVKGLQLLESLARHDGAAGITELAAELELGKSTVHRLLQTLVALGYAHHDEAAGAYRISLKLWELGTVVEKRLDLTTVSATAMAELLRDTRETVHLSILDGNEVIYVAKLDSPEPVRAYSEIGGRAPAHCVATGKAMLAWQNPVTLKAMSLALHRHTPHTFTDPEAFLSEMHNVRQLGYAVNRGEWRESVWGVAAPIPYPGGIVRAAIGISGPSNRVRAEVIDPLAQRVMAAAQGVARQLGK